MPHPDEAFILVIDSKSTQRSMLQLPLEILSEPDTNPFECTSSDVEKAYLTLDLCCSSIDMQIVKFEKYNIYNNIIIIIIIQYKNMTL